jgi:hypothetical protein
MIRLISPTGFKPERVELPGGKYMTPGPDGVYELPGECRDQLPSFVGLGWELERVQAHSLAVDEIFSAALFCGGIEVRDRRLYVKGEPNHTLTFLLAAHRNELVDYVTRKGDKWQEVIA